MNEKECLRYIPENYITKQIGKRIYLFNKNTKLAFSIYEREYNVLTSLSELHNFVDLYDKLKNDYSKEEFLELIENFKKIGVFNYHSSNKKFEIHLKFYLNNLNDFFQKLMFMKEYFYLISFILLILIFIINIFNNNIVTYEKFKNQLFYFNIDKTIYYAIMIICSILSIFIHEMSHAIIASIENVFVPVITLSFRFIFIKAHTSIIGINTLKNKRNKIIIYAAGNFMHLFLLNIGLLLKNYPIISSAIVFPNFILLMFNLSILFKSDTHKILSLFLKSNVINLYKMITVVLSFLTVALLLLLGIINLIMFDVIFMIIAVQAIYSLILTLISCLVKYIFANN